MSGVSAVGVHVGGVPGTRFPGYLRAKFPFPGKKKKSGIC